MLISSRYKEQIQLLHKKDPTWGSISTKHLSQVLRLCETFETKDVLDYGCGKGGIANGLPFPIKEYDPGIPEKDIVPEPADLVLCLDVLEHVEPECIHDVFKDLKRCIKKIGYFKICTQSASEYLSDGRNAHLLIRNWFWWIERISQYFEIMEVHVHPYTNKKGGHEVFLFVLPQ